MTTKQDIRKWLESGLEKNATHVIVVVDTFDWEDYPVYVSPDDDVRKKEIKYKETRMQRVMEIYNLSMDLDEQLNESRAWNY